MGLLTLKLIGPTPRNSPRGTSDHVFKEQALTSIDLWQLHAARAQLVY